MIEPFAVHQLPEWDFDDAQSEVMRNVAVGIFGSTMFSDDKLDIVFYTIKLLRANPDLARIVLEP